MPLVRIGLRAPPAQDKQVGANKILRPACYSQMNRSVERRFDSYLRCEGQPLFAMCPGLPENSRDASHTKP
jgi:hypothetical protein